MVYDTNSSITDAPCVAAVIVTYNSADVLAGCLQSLADQQPPLAAVVVADNASKDQSCYVAEQFAAKLSMLIVQTGRNGGYAAGINAGIAALDLSRLDAVLVLNPDCRVRRGALSVLASTLRRTGHGIVVPNLVTPDGSLQTSLRRKPSVGRALAEALLPGDLAGRFGPLGERVTNPQRYRRPGVTAWATGAALLLSVPAMLEVGPWDESFLLYSEETEYCMRAADRGWLTWYEPAAVFEHIGGLSETKPRIASLLTVNKVTLFRRRHNPVHSAAYFAAVAMGESIRAIAGRPTSRASLMALLHPSRRVRELAP